MTMDRLSRACLTLLVPFIALVAGCGGGDPAKQYGSGAGQDGGDGGAVTGEAGVLDDGSGGPDDGGAYADAAVPLDAETGNEQPDGGDGPRQLEVTREDSFEFDLSQNDRIWDHHGYCLAAGGSEFALAFQAHVPGEDCTTRIDVVRISSLTQETERTTEVNTDLAQCSIAKEPAIVSAPEGWRLVWTDNRGGKAALYRLDLGSDSGISQLTQSGLVESRASLVEVNGKIMLGWIAELAGVEQTISTRMLGEANSNPVELVSEDDGRQPVELALGPDGSFDGAIAWMDLGAQNKGFFFQPVDGNGKSRGSPELLSTFAYSGGSIDVTGSEHGGGLVYSIAIGDSEQIRFRTFDLGGVKADERKIVSPPYEAKDASIAWFGGHGFLIAYRVLSGPGIDSPKIRLVSVDTGASWSPDDLRPIDVADAEADGGRTTIRISKDGVVMVAWLDAVRSDQKALKAVRLR